MYTTATATAANGPGSVTAAPNLPAGFTDTFRSVLVEAGGIRQHAVIGGSGPAVLLVHGWPQNWYAWRHLMPGLAENFTVVAVDQRGVGLTDTPPVGYDSATLAADLAALMTELGHERFAVAGHDIGMAIGYAIAADFPERVDRLVVAEIPGLPGTVPAPPLFVPGPLSERLWHIPFNRAGAVAEQLVTGREDIFFGYEFAIQGGTPLPAEAIDYYVDGLRTPEALAGSFGFYRAWDTMMAQNEVRAKELLQIPVLAVGGELSWGEHVAEGMRAVAADVQSVVLRGAGHWVHEQEPEQYLAALNAFLAPYLASAR